MTEKRKLSADADYALDLLVAAGHITREQAFQTRDITLQFADAPREEQPKLESIHPDEMRRLFEMALRDRSFGWEYSVLRLDDGKGDYFDPEVNNMWRGYRHAFMVQTVILDRLSPQRKITRDMLRRYRKGAGLEGYGDEQTTRIIRAAVAVLASTGIAP